MFLKTNLGYLSQVALKNMQLLVLIYRKKIFGTQGITVKTFSNLSQTSWPESSIVSLNNYISENFCQISKLEAL